MGLYLLRYRYADLNKGSVGVEGFRPGLVYSLGVVTTPRTYPAILDTVQGLSLKP